MIALYIFLGILLWVILGILAYGKTFGHFQNKFPSIASEMVEEDRKFAFLVACFGPIGFFTTFILSEYPCQWKTKTRTTKLPSE